MRLSGALAPRSVPDLLSWIGQTGKKGSLELENANTTTTIHVDRNHVLSCSTTDPSLHLGRFLVARGGIRESDLAWALVAVDASAARKGSESGTKTLLGRVLLDRGLIDEDRLRRVLRVKTEETVFDAFAWQGGEFRFQTSEMAAHEMLPFAIGIGELVERGWERLEAWSWIRDRVPSGEARPRVVRSLHGSALDPVESLVFAELAQGSSVREAARRARLTDYEAHHAAARLVASEVLDFGCEPGHETSTGAACMGDAELFGMPSPGGTS